MNKEQREDEARKYGTYARQRELLGMIHDVDRFLKSKGVKYSLCGGTLLGAVREQGFIPWDDDIDIMVDRENYGRIIRAFAADRNSDYALNDYLWVKRIQKRGDTREGILSATIDVFVMDNCPDNQMVKRGKVLVLKMLQGMMKTERPAQEVSLFYKLCLGVTHGMGKLVPYKTKLKWYDAASQIGNKKQSRTLGLYNDLFKYLNLTYSRSMFKEYMDVPFEDLTLPITKEYDNYLSTVYGDYMTPPDESERNPIHMD